MEILKNIISKNGNIYTFICISVIIFELIVFSILLYIACKKFKLIIHSKNIIDKHLKSSFIINVVLGFLSICIQYFLFNYYSGNLPLVILIFITLTFFSYFLLSFYCIKLLTKLEVTEQDLAQTKLYNKTLSNLNDNIRCFKHDFYNIIQAIGGYVDTNDTDGLKKYYKQLTFDCEKTNNLDVLNPNIINNPAIYNIIASKYYQAYSLNISINFEILLDLNTLKMKIYEFTRILGILLDNAIEACTECKDKIINIIMKNDNNRQLVIIENTYENKYIDTEKIYEKSYTTKPNNTGLGLWEVRKILNKNNNLNLFTSKNDEYFKQQLEIY